MRPILASAAFLFLVAISACDNPVDPENYVWRFVNLQDAAQVTAHLDSRVFRQFDPSRNAATRKAITIDFTDGLRLWAQNTEDGNAVDEWEVLQDYYWIERAQGEPIYRFDFPDPTVRRLLPEESEDSVDATGLTILVWDYGRKDEIQFALWDSVGHLPPPFPVFRSWTRFAEDDPGR